ncbi:S9 family peptidase [Kiloniella laminariae]|uniref:S9 family peptidase n=1 Tax=Kiloniella laminariae TaxID=454162 RepID=A0ABT4LDQ8_9PROT|nr:S9 family peptidase [Kiloniella laminariae]MCZ4279230.1 S9 family peptidase [Kiloniella laminariae]
MTTPTISVNSLAPKAEKKPFVHEMHGQQREDSYAWLRAENWQEVMREPTRLAPDIRDYLEQENGYCEAVMADQEELKQKLFEELKGRIKEDDSSVPSPDGPWLYYTRYEEGAQHPIFCRKKRDGLADEVVLLDGNREAEGKDYFQLASCVHSPDHRYLAYSVDEKGSEYYSLKVRDLETGAELDDLIENTSGAVVWAADNRTLFYTVLDENHRPSKVLRHLLGDDENLDVQVYEEPDAGFFVGVGKSESGRFIQILAHDHQTSEVHLIPANTPATAPAVVAPRQTGLEYEVSDHDDRLLILTNADGAEDFKICTAPIATPSQEHWQDLLSHKPGVLVLSLIVFEKFMARLERVEGLPRIVITSFVDGEEHQISFDEEAYSLGMSGGYEFKTTNLRFSYSSLSTPSRVYDYDMASRERVLRKEDEIPSGHNSEDYIVRRLMAPSHDGALVPISILYRKDTELAGEAPLLLYAYGSYGNAIPAGFQRNSFSLVDRGFVYAIAHIRGGTDKGYGWYKEGKMLKKKNTFLDFIAAAEHLIKEGFTSAGRIAAHGGSAGGMLMGVVSNQRPDLFKAVVADVPFVDVLTTMSDASLPLTPPEWPEWGNPITDIAAYEYIRSYSPVDNVTAQDYPNMLVTAGLSDPRVTYWEPAKWVARLRELKTDNNLLLFKTNMSAGHGGASGRFERLKEVALMDAFLLKVFAV